MAVVKFDPVTYKGHWKIIPDNSAPTVFFVLRKPLAFFKQASATSVLIYDQSGIATIIATTAADAIDADGNTMATAAVQLTYITQNNSDI